MAVRLNAAQLSTISTSVGMSTLKGHWNFAFEKRMLELKVDQFFRENIHVVPIEKLALPSTQFIDNLTSDEDFEYVPWDGSCVTSAEKRLKPYSTQFLCCIALLARGYLPGKDQPSQFGLAHVMKKASVKRCVGILRDIQKEISNGKIEVFIAGGYYGTEDLYEDIIAEIGNFQNEETCLVDIVEDRFAMMDLQGIHLETKEGFGHIGLSGLSFAGFDKENNPIAVLSVRFPSFELSKETFKQFSK